MKNKLEFFDTHAHSLYQYKSKEFYENRHEYLKKAFKSGVKVIVNAPITMESNFQMIHEFETYPWKEDFADVAEDFLPQVGVAIGEHPLDAGKVDLEYPDEKKDRELEKLCTHKRVCAVKTGLDYSRGRDSQERQKERFRKLIRLSKAHNLSLVLHIRDAYEDGLEILKQEAEGKLYRGVVHCFTQGPEVAKAFVEKGFFLGIGGKVSYERNEELREAVKKIPLEHLVLETDCPLIPLQGSKSISNSADISEIAKVVAELKGISQEEVAAVTFKNGERLFLLKETQG